MRVIKKTSKTNAEAMREKSKSLGRHCHSTVGLRA